MYRLTIPEEMQSSLPVFNKPIDILKLALYKIYNEYKAGTLNLVITPKVKVGNKIELQKILEKYQINDENEQKHISSEDVAKLL